MSTDKKCKYCNKAVERDAVVENDSYYCDESCHKKAERFQRYGVRFRNLYLLLTVAGAIPIVLNFCGVLHSRGLTAAGLFIVAAVMALYPFPRPSALETSGIQMVRIIGWVFAALLAAMGVAYLLGFMG